MNAKIFLQVGKKIQPGAVQRLMTLYGQTG
jgi:hypothetical protein